MYVNLIIISELCRNFNNYSIPIAVCKVFLTCQRKKERKKETGRSLSLFSSGKLLLDRSLFLAAEQRADAEGDLLLLLVDGGDLRVDHLAFGQDVGGLVDAAVSDLGDMDY